MIKSCRRTKDSDHEDHGIIVEDINEANRRMEIIQSRIDAAEMLGIGTREYEERAKRPVHLAKGLTVGEKGDKTQIRVHTIQQSRQGENTIFRMDMDVWEKKLPHPHRRTQ